MNEPTIYQQASQLDGQFAARLEEGGEVKLPAVQLAHFPVADTALAACLGTLGVPFRDPAPFTDDVALDGHGNEISRRVLWWLGDSSGNDASAHRTEDLLGAWIERARFAEEHPLHPLVSMRAAIDARRFWVSAKHAHRAGAATLPIELRPGTAFYATESIHGASVLRACGFAPLAFTGRAFFLQRNKDGLEAETLLLTAAQNEGATPPQWMSRVLSNYSALLKIAKANSVIIREQFDDQTLLLTADATPRTRDKFFALL